MIEIRDMSTSYRDGEDFRIPELTLSEGKITGIIGRNGSGKTTLLKTIAGQLRYRGSIRISGKECSSLRSMERAREISYLPQSLRSANIDVRTLVEHGRYPYTGSMRHMSDKDRKIVEHAMEITGMRKLADKNLQELSGGERQRAYLSMVIAQDTGMILLDEPTTFMDVSSQKSFYEIIRRMKENDRGIVMVVHDLEQCFGTCDEICIMDQRTLVSSGSPEKLIREGEQLRKVFGISLKKTNDKETLYPYVIRK